MLTALSPSRLQVSRGSRLDLPSAGGGQPSPTVAGPTTVRFGLVAIAASLVAHVAIMELIGLADPPPPPTRAPAAVRIAIASAPPRPAAPIGIELVVTPAAPPAAAPAMAATRAAPRATALDRSASAAEVATAVATAAAVAPAAIETAAPGGSGDPSDGSAGGVGLLRMRRPTAPDLAPRHIAEQFDLGGGAAPPPALVPSGELDPSGGGTARSDQAGFSARVARDGRASFRDKPAFSIHWRLPDPRAIARGLESWYRDPAAAIREGAVDPQRDQVANEDGKPGDKPDHGGTVPIIRGTAELTDYIMRRGGIDPYASAKRDWLARTRDERTAMRATRDAELLATSVDAIRKHLARVWLRTEVDVARRRAAIFALWDDCAETGDAAVVDAGDRARSAVIGYVRAHLPADSPDAFTAAELAALNQARTSKAIFAPYE